MTSFSSKCYNQFYYYFFSNYLTTAKGVRVYRKLFGRSRKKNIRLDRQFGLRSNYIDARG